MKKKIIRAVCTLVIPILLLTVPIGFGRKAAAPEPAPVSTPETAETLSDEQALTAIRNYCCAENPDLEDIVNAGDYPTYWELISGDEQEIVVLFRSYTGAQKRFYIDRSTGDTYATEFVPGITDEEVRTDESFNVKDYL